MGKFQLFGNGASPRQINKTVKLIYKLMPLFLLHSPWSTLSQLVSRERCY